MSEINVPILFINRINGDKKMFDLVGGCKGVSIEDEHVYRPHFSYAIVENKRETYKLKYSNKWTEMNDCFELILITQIFISI